MVRSGILKKTFFFFPFSGYAAAHRGGPVIAQLCCRNSCSVVSGLTHTSPRGGGVVSERLLRCDWRRACADDRRESPGKLVKVARGVTGQRWRLSPRAGNFIWDVLELMFCLKNTAVSFLFWRIFFFRLGRESLIKHEWSSSLRMETRTEQAAAVLWEPVHVRPPVVSYQLIQVV